MSKVKHIIPLGPTIVSNFPGSDGYTLTVVNDEAGPTIYIDDRTVDAYGLQFSRDGYIGTDQGDIVFGGDNVIVRPSLLADTRVEVGGNLNILPNTLQVPGTNIETGSESTSLQIEITGEKTLLSPYEQSIFKIRNFDTDVMRVDGYGSIFLGDTTDGYGLDSSRIVFNANRFDQPEAPNDAYSAGLVIERGSSAAQAKMFWNEGTDRWEEDQGDGINRHITSFDKTTSSNYNPICQDSVPFSESIKQSWQRALIHRIEVTTNSPDYNLEIFNNAALDDRKFFNAIHLVGDLDASTAFYYKDADGYNELHYRITNNDAIAHFFSLSVSAEVFFDGYDKPGGFIETFDGGGAFCGLVFENLLDEDFDDAFFDAGGTELLDEPFDDIFFDAGGAGLLTEDFDSYGIFDAYAGSILDSDDMNVLGF